MRCRSRLDLTVHTLLARRLPAKSCLPGQVVQSFGLQSLTLLMLPQAPPPRRRFTVAMLYQQPDLSLPRLYQGRSSQAVPPVM